ncbi:hypothetical protein ANN_03517 [Periplaneta americana]|uniref:Uncharacterized protein n=1 Tax=Periplaneta americana TaxID=6978 RepID=A0ABQ8TZ97_PERAM|nr:hypothetical protein ANN_03517 [Periplaneta americana]
MFENTVLRKIFGAKRDEVTGEWKKLYYAELHALYSSPDIIRNIKSRRLRWAGHVARMGEYRNAYRVLVGRLEAKRPLERPRRRWEYNIKMDLREVGYDDREWINLAQDKDIWRAYVRAAMNLRVDLPLRDSRPHLRVNLIFCRTVEIAVGAPRKANYCPNFTRGSLRGEYGPCGVRGETSVELVLARRYSREMKSRIRHEITWHSLYTAGKSGKNAERGGREKERGIKRLKRERKKKEEEER